MTRKDLQRLKKELDVELPENYERLLLSLPRSKSDSIIELSNKADDLIEMNRRAQMGHAFDDFPPFFVIGENGCGDYYAIDTDDDDSPVFFWDHESTSFLKNCESPSLIEFAGIQLKNAKTSKTQSVRRHQDAPDRNLVWYRDSQGARSVTFSPDGITLALGSVDGTIKLWNMEGKLVSTIEGHDLEIRSVAFSPDGGTMASGSWDKTIRLWEVQTWK